MEQNNINEIRRGNARATTEGRKACQEEEGRLKN